MNILNKLNGWQRIWAIIAVIYFCISTPILITNQPWENMVNNIINSINVAQTELKTTEPVANNLLEQTNIESNVDNNVILTIPKLGLSAEEIGNLIDKFETDEISFPENQTQSYIVSDIIINILLLLLIIIIYWLLPMFVIYFGGYNIIKWLIDGFKK